MKLNKTALNLLLFGLPLSSYASGQNVLTLIGLEIILLLVFIFLLFTLKITLRGKSILVLIFVLTHIGIYTIVGKLPYNENQILINTLIFGLPILTVIITYLLIRKKFKNIN